MDAKASRLVDASICKGETTRELDAELELNYKTVLTMRHRVQANAELEQPNTALPDSHSETDEMFHAKRAGEKRRTALGSRRPAPKTSQQTTRTWDVRQ